MDKALNEIGKLRHEMKIGFIELENQMQSGSDKMQVGLDKLRDEMKQSNELFIKTMDKFSKNVEAGFLAVEGAIEQDLKDIRSELSEIKKRLDQGNL